MNLLLPLVSCFQIGVFRMHHVSCFFPFYNFTMPFFSQSCLLHTLLIAIFSQFNHLALAMMHQTEIKLKISQKKVALLLNENTLRMSFYIVVVHSLESSHSLFFLSLSK